MKHLCDGLRSDKAENRGSERHENSHCIKLSRYNLNGTNLHEQPYVYILRNGLFPNALPFVLVINVDSLKTNSMRQNTVEIKIGEIKSFAWQGW